MIQVRSCLQWAARCQSAALIMRLGQRGYSKCAPRYLYHICCLGKPCPLGSEHTAQHGSSTARQQLLAGQAVPHSVVQHTLATCMTLACDVRMALVRSRRGRRWA